MTIKFADGKKQFTKAIILLKRLYKENSIRNYFFNCNFNPPLMRLSRTATQLCAGWETPTCQEENRCSCSDPGFSLSSKCTATSSGVKKPSTPGNAY